MNTLSKEELVARLKTLGAYDVRVADPHKGFEHSIPERHPLAIFPKCRSVVVFIVPKPAWVNNTSLGVYTKNENPPLPHSVPGVLRLVDSTHHQIASLRDYIFDRVWYGGAYFINRHGYHVADSYNRELRPQEKLCAYEAGLGVYGRSGMILHPELGNRISPGVLLTDAPLEADEKVSDYQPCGKCSACVRICPGGAYEPSKTYPESFTNKQCHSARYALQKEGKYCHECFRVCPAAKVPEKEMVIVRRVTSQGDKIPHDNKQNLEM